MALYLVGATGDQVPYLQASRHVVHADGSVGRVDIHEEGFTLVDLLGQRLGDAVVRAADGIVPAPTTTFGLQRYGVSVMAQAFSPHNAPKGPVKSFDYQTSGPTTLPVVQMQLGDAVWVGVQPEFSAVIGARIRDASPYAQTLVTTMTDGVAKYLPDAPSYERFTYEARSSPYARGAAETAANTIVQQLKQMKGRQP